MSSLSLSHLSTSRKLDAYNVNSILRNPSSSDTDAYSVDELDLSFNRLEKLPDIIKSLTHLKALYLSNNKLRKLPSWISQLTGLQKLYLNYNMIASIPPTIAALTKLQVLRLNNNNLVELPPSLATLRHIVSPTDLRDNPLAHIPEHVRPEPFALDKSALIPLWDYLDDLSREGQKHWHSVKVLCLGKEASGKTHLMRRLQGLKAHDGISTDGIDVTHFSMGRLPLVWFDFGGQEIFYPTHRLFLTDQCIYVVVFSVIDPAWKSRVRYWLYLIERMTTPGRHAQIVLVGTHLDKVKGNALLNDIRAQLSPVLLRNVHLVFVSNVKKVGSKINEFESALREAIHRDKLDSLVVPTAYHRVHKLVKRLDVATMSWSELMQLVHMADPPLPSAGNEPLLRRAISFLHNMGVLFYSQENRLLVLDPQWLSKRFADLISFKHNFVKSGHAEIASLRHIWPDSSLRATLISLFQRFHIGFLVSDKGPFIVPSLLPEEEPAEVASFSFPCHRRYRSKRLPLSFFSRFLFLISQSDTIIHMWRTGFVIRSAVVRCDASFVTIQGTLSDIARIAAALEMLNSRLKESEQLVCPHCIERGLEPPRLIGWQERVSLMMQRSMSFKCGEIDVFIERLGEDLTFGSLPVITCDDLELGVKLGEGAFGVVHKCTWKGQTVAYKRAKSMQVPFDEFRKEVALMHNIVHENCVRVLAVTLKPELGMVVEYCEGGDLSDALKDGLSYEAKMRVLIDVSRGLAALHELGIAHRDIKASNVFVVSLDADAPVCAKVADFGEAAQGGGMLLTEKRGTLAFMAPELLDRSSSYTLSCDVYSFAMLLYQVFTNGRNPWSDPAFDRFAEKRLTPPIRFCLICAGEWFQNNTSEEVGPSGELFISKDGMDSSEDGPPPCRQTPECLASVSYCKFPSKCCEEWFATWTFDQGGRVVKEGAPLPPSCGQCPQSKILLNQRSCFAGYVVEMKNAVERAVVNGLRPAKPRNAPDIITELWAGDPAKRPSFDEVSVRLSEGDSAAGSASRAHRSKPLVSCHHILLHETPKSSIISSCMFQDRVFLATSEHVYIFDMSSSSLVDTIAIQGRVESVVVDHRGQLFIGGTHLSTGDGELLIENADISVLALLGERLIAGHADGTIRTYSLEGKQLGTRVGAAQDSIVCLSGSAFHGTRRALYTADGQTLGDFAPRAMSAIGNKLWVCSRDTADLYVFAISSSSLLAHIPNAMQDRIRVLSVVTMHNKKFVFGGCHNQVCAWDSETMEQVFEMEVDGTVRVIVAPSFIELDVIWVCAGQKILKVAFS